MLLTIVVFLLILSVLVLIHEAGHYFVAKKLGVKVEEFGFGFPPRVWGKKVGETVYSVNLLPIGGFVKLYGEDEAGAGKLQIPNNKSQITKNMDRAFFSRPVWQRASIIFAGVFMNFVLATAIISYLFAFHGVPSAGDKVEIVALVKHAPAQQAGLQVGETILSVDGKRVTDPNEVISYVKAHLGKKIAIQVQNKTGVQDIHVTPRVHYPETEGAMGIEISQNIITKTYPWYQAPWVGLKESIQESWMIVQGLWQAVTTVAVQHQVPQGLAGPVGIAELTGQFIKIGPFAVLSLVSLLSLNLAILNILPIPALDGGRLFFILLEGVTRRKVNQQFEAYAHAVGMILLLALIAFITFHDLYMVFTHQPLLPK